MRKLNLKKIVKSWWFVLLLCPLLVPTIREKLFGSPKQTTITQRSEKGDNIVGNKTTTNIGGDYVRGDKISHTRNPIEFKALKADYVDQISKELNKFKRNYPGIKFKILLKTINPNKGTNEFAKQFQNIMRTSDINVKLILSNMQVGGNIPYSIVISFNKSYEVVMLEFIQALSPFFSIKNKKNYETTNESTGEFDLIINLYNELFFDQDGKIYFQNDSV